MRWEHRVSKVRYRALGSHKQSHLGSFNYASHCGEGGSVAYCDQLITASSLFSLGRHRFKAVQWIHHSLKKTLKKVQF